jgi:hypothetical protein
MRPGTALGVGIASHALLDLLPHKDVSAHKAEGLMTAIVLGIVATSCGVRSAPFICAVGGILPDVEQVLPWTDPRRGNHRWFPTHSRGFHSLPLPGARSWRVSLLVQASASMSALLISIARCRK